MMYRFFSFSAASADSRGPHFLQDVGSCCHKARKHSGGTHHVPQPHDSHSFRGMLRSPNPTVILRMERPRPERGSDSPRPPSTWHQGGARHTWGQAPDDGAIRTSKSRRAPRTAACCTAQHSQGEGEFRTHLTTAPHFPLEGPSKSPPPSGFTSNKSQLRAPTGSQHHS